MSTRKVWLASLIAVSLGAFAGPAVAQGILPDAPQATDINPPSGQRGATVEVNLTGQKLVGTKDILLRFSAYPTFITATDRGLKAEVTTSNEGQVQAKIVIPNDAPAGLHEVRAITAQGVTNPVYFYVSQNPQTPETEPNHGLSDANKITLPATIAGAINGVEDQDSFTFDAKANDTITFDVEGFKRYSAPQNQQNGIIYLDSFLLLRDASGQELAYSDDSTRLDAFLAYKFPADGKYTITIRDNQYRGRGDFHYRLTMGKAPQITAIFPAGGPKGTKLPVTVFGYNLDANGATQLRRVIDLNGNAGVQEFRMTTAAGISNAVPVVADDYPENSEVEPNDRPQNATTVSIPATCSGKFDSLEDVDGFRFQAQAGQQLILEVQAGRLGSPVDTLVTLMDRSGRLIGRDDDAGGRSDSRLQIGIPRTDEYVAYVRNQTKSGMGPQYYYRLTVRPLTPSLGIALRQEGVDRQGNPAPVDVNSVAAPQGGSVDFDLALFRNEGQGGDVTVSLNAPPNLKGLKLEQLIKTRLMNKDGTLIEPPQFKITVNPSTIVKNGQSAMNLRLNVPEDAPVGTYLNVNLRFSGVAGAQPLVINRPLWVSVTPK